MKQRELVKANNGWDIANRESGGVEWSKMVMDVAKKR